LAEVRSHRRKYSHRESGRGVPEGEKYAAVFEWHYEEEAKNMPSSEKDRLTPVELT
jgi:hypothetical protein